MERVQAPARESTQGEDAESPRGEPRLDSTLTKGMAILEDLAGSRDGKGVSALARDLGLTKSNTFRLLQTLLALGYVKREPDKTYRATLKTWQVGRAAVENLNLRSIAHPLLQFLADETKETIYLAVRENLQVVYIDKIDSQKPIRSWNPIGGTAPLHAVGTGKAILAVEYDQLRAQIAEHLVRYTDKTITQIAELDRDIASTRLNGYAVDQGEFRDRIYSIGSALVLANGIAVGAIGVSLPDVNLSSGEVERIGALVTHAAKAVNERLAQQ